MLLRELLKKEAEINDVVDIFHDGKCERVTITSPDLFESDVNLSCLLDKEVKGFWVKRNIITFTKLIKVKL